MNPTNRSALRAATDPVVARAAGAIRRMAITFTAKALWQLAGFRMPDGSAETRQAEPFTGIGFYARPAADGKPEAIALMVGDANTPVIVAVRDEKTRAAVAGGVQAGETMMFTPLAMVYLTSAGTIEIRSVGGAAAALATKADVDALASWIHTTMTVTTPGAGAGPSTPGTTNAPPAAAGTTKLKGE